MKLIMFAGPGGVGKTTQLEGLVAKAQSNGKKIAFHKSSTRKTYAKAGLLNEVQALNDPVANQIFQDKVFSDNVEDLLECIKKGIDDGADVFITDRSPFDYLSYYFTVFQPFLTIDKIKQKRDACRVAMRRIEELNDVSVILFNYPVNWSTDTESSDNWRSDTTGKNFIWGAVLRNELEMYKSSDTSIPESSSAQEFTDALYNLYIIT